MIKENNTVGTRNGILDEKFLKLVREHWKELPSLFKERIVKEHYSDCSSLRKTARTLGIGRSTAYHYVKHKDPIYRSFSTRNEVNLDTLRNFVNSIQKQTGNQNRNHHLYQDEAQYNKQSR